MEENRLDVPQRPSHEIGFRDDLRPPTVSWGHCAITGEWGPVVGVDLGDISVDAPSVDEGVIYDPESKEVTFTVWKPAIFEQQLTVSREGLLKLIGWLDNQQLPVPGITPVLCYQWQVMYDDGSTVSQFYFDPETSAERENNSSVIDFTRVTQTSVIPHLPHGDGLPSYTYVFATNKTFRDGIDISDSIQEVYRKERHEQAQIFCKRKVTHTWGSQMKGDGLDREVINAHTTILYLLGWQTWEQGPCCIISVDERGNWRPWLYN